MIDPNRFDTYTLQNHYHGNRIKCILSSALEAVDPYKALKHYMQRDGSNLKIGNLSYDLERFDRVLMVGFGKASQLMGVATAEILGNHLSEGIIITKGKITTHIPGISLLEGAHPVPDNRSIINAQKIVDLLSTTNNKDLIICLISGGGSALITLPVARVTLGDLQTLTRILLGCGATINEINCLRKHLSQIKGGQLVRLAAPASIATLILSDVISDPLDVIASGPTVPDPSTFLDAIKILEKYEIVEKIPTSIIKHLQNGQSGEISETPKAGESIFKNVQNTIIGNNYLAAKTAIKQAKIEGFNTLLLTTSLQGEARIAGKLLAAIAKQVDSTGEPISRPACIIAGGETTVTLRGDGKGGRNQEMALGAVEELSGIEDVMLITLATDGNDGPTDAAGAVVTGETMRRASRIGENPSKYLAINASYKFFDQLGDLIKPGMTGTNVNDLGFLILF